MATLAMVSDVKQKIRSLESAFQAMERAFDEFANSGGRAGAFSSQWQDVSQKRDQLEASVNTLETHLNKKSEFKKLLQKKYKKAGRFLDDRLE